MSTEITAPKQTGLGALSALRAGLSSVTASLPKSSNIPILKMNNEKDGWCFGKDGTHLPLGTEVVFNAITMKHGYVCWTDRDAKRDGRNELLEERMWSLTEVRPMLHEMPAMTDPKTGQACEWKLALLADGKVLSGKSKGTQVVYKPSSLGGTQALAGLMDAIAEKFDSYPQDHAGPMYVLPIVELQQKDPYANKSGGRTYPPRFDIVGWMDVQGNEEGDDTVDGPAAVSRVAKEPEPAPAPVDDEPAATTTADDAAPRRRRRE